MKVCNSCHKVFSDNNSFCNVCGKTLMKKTVSFNAQVVCVIIASCLVVLFLIADSVKHGQKRQEIESYRTQKMLDDYRSENNKASKYDLKIESGYTISHKGNYIYINGSVKNVGDKDITYFEVGANFLNASGRVVDSDYTNDGQTLKPQASRKFEIMHKNSNDIKSVSLEVLEVS